MLCLGRKLEVQWDENGNLTVVGRCTDKVKIHGNRVEPAEIESVFKRLTGAGWAAVRAFAEEGSSGLLCVYYTNALSLDEDALRHRMEAYLPYYMIPSCFLRIEEIPLRPNGKLDRKALPAPLHFGRGERMKLKKTVRRMLSMKPDAWYVFIRSIQLCCLLLLCAFALLVECNGDLLGRYPLYISAQSLNETAQGILLVALILSVCIEELQRNPAVGAALSVSLRCSLRR